MIDIPLHAFIAETIPDGGLCWHCDTCGRTILVDDEGIHIVERGDQAADHTRGIGLLNLGMDGETIE